VLTRYSSFKTNNCNCLSQLVKRFQKIPCAAPEDATASLSCSVTDSARRARAAEIKLFTFSIVTRVRSRTSKGITDLLLPQTSSCFNTKSPSKKCFRVAAKKIEFKERAAARARAAPSADCSAPQQLPLVSRAPATHNEAPFKLLQSTIYQAEVSFVIGINQTIQTTN
jgi:hypothetical protein